MHTFFTWKMYTDLKSARLKELCLRLDRSSKSYLRMFELFYSWNRIAEKLRREEITQDEYDEWRYHYPKLETERFRNEVLAFRKNESNN